MTINPNLTVNEFLDSVDFGSSLSLSFPELQSKYQELSGKSLDVPSAITNECQMKMLLLFDTYQRKSNMTTV